MPTRKAFWRREGLNTKAERVCRVVGKCSGAGLGTHQMRHRLRCRHEHGFVAGNGKGKGNSRFLRFAAE